ncbi:hypothetical protein MTQ17_08390 [Corynebacterium bovis]|uniref:hypothetical protein n=1 Tax=Corynebacterium bovis TaxID=36808 RepID=UPI00313A2653
MPGRPGVGDVAVEALELVAEVLAALPGVGDAERLLRRLAGEVHRGRDADGAQHGDDDHEGDDPRALRRGGDPPSAHGDGLA